jgi:YVTN family beta-propeller protein
LVWWRRRAAPPKPHLGHGAGGAGSRSAHALGIDDSTAPIAAECQSFLDNVIAQFDGVWAWNLCSSFSPETVVIATAGHKIIGHVKQESPFCPDIAATPDGNQVWLTLKDVGSTMVFNARPPFDVIKAIDTGPITNHVNIVRNVVGQFAYVTVGGLNMVKVFKTDTFELVATIPTGALPHGLWPSGDGTRVYVGLENADSAAVIDTLENKVIDTIAIGQAPQGVAYVPNAVPEGDGTPDCRPSNHSCWRSPTIQKALGDWNRSLGS